MKSKLKLKINWEKNSAINQKREEKGVRILNKRIFIEVVLLIEISLVNFRTKWFKSYIRQDLNGLARFKDHVVHHGVYCEFLLLCGRLLV